MPDVQADRQKLETLYELSKELARSEVYVIRANAMRILAIVRILLGEFASDQVTEHPVDFE